MRRGALLLAMALVVMAQAGDGARVRFLRPPSVVPAGETLTLIVQVEDDPENRLLVVAAADAAGLVRSSDESLDEFSPHTRWLRWVGGLPPGELLLTATVYGPSNRVLARATHTLTVVSRGP